MLKHTRNLRRCYATDREVWKSILCKEFDLTRFVSRVCRAIDDFATKEHLVDGEWMSRHVTMMAIVPNRGELSSAHLKARFLGNFAFDALGRGLVHIGPSSWQRPLSIARFADKQDTAFAEDGAPHIHLGGGITGVLLKELQDRFQVSARSSGHHRRRDGSNSLVAFPIEFVFGVGEADLSDGLQLAHMR